MLAIINAMCYRLTCSPCVEMATKLVQIDELMDHLPWMALPGQEAKLEKDGSIKTNHILSNDGNLDGQGRQELGPGESGSTKSNNSNMFHDKNGDARTIFYLDFILILIFPGDEIYWCYCLTPGSSRFMIDIICSIRKVSIHGDIIIDKWIHIYGILLYASLTMVKNLNRMTHKHSSCSSFLYKVQSGSTSYWGTQYFFPIPDDWGRIPPHLSMAASGGISLSCLGSRKSIPTYLNTQEYVRLNLLVKTFLDLLVA
ncbi:hypothetical protein POUND7_013039 [Theobroma cacao]